MNFSFWRGRTIDMIFLYSMSLKLYMLRIVILLNLTKTFHSVGHDTLWKVLKELSNPDKILRVALFFHKDMKMYVILP